MIQFLFLLFFATLPIQFALSPMPGVDLHISRIFAIVLSAIWIFRSLARRTLLIPNKPETIFLSAFFFLSTFSLFFAEHFSWGLRKLLFLCSFFPIFFVAFSVFGEAKMRERFAKALVFGSAISGLIGIAQFFLPFIVGLNPAILLWQRDVVPFFSGETFSGVVSEYSSMVVNVGGANFLRASAFFPDPHIASLFWGMSLPFSVALAFRPERRNHRAIFLATSFVIFVADILTFSRGGYFALIAMGLVSTGVIFPSLIRKYFPALGISVAITLFLVVFPNPVSERVSSSFDLSDHSTSGRIEIWKEAIGIIREHPIFGVGIGNYSSAVFPSATYREPRYAHDIFLDIAAETGVLNAAFFFAALALAITRSLSKRENSFLFAIGCSLLVFATHSLFETPLYSVHILPLFLSLIAVPL